MRSKLLGKALPIIIAFKQQPKCLLHSCRTLQSSMQNAENMAHAGNNEGAKKSPFPPLSFPSPSPTLSPLLLIPLLFPFRSIPFPFHPFSLPIPHIQLEGLRSAVGSPLFLSIYSYPTFLQLPTESRGRDVTPFLSALSHYYTLHISPTINTHFIDYVKCPCSVLA